MFNWLNLLLAIPSVVQGVQLIHGDQPGTTRKQKALQWLGLGLGTAEAVGGINSQQAQVVGNAIEDVSAVIDSVVNIFKKTGAPGFRPAEPVVTGGKATIKYTDNPPAPAPLPPPKS